MFEGQCVYGASLMCKYALNNTDYGSCSECMINSEKAENTNSYCIPSIPKEDTLDRIFLMYP